MAPSVPAPPPPSLQEATRKATVAWQDDLQSLFHHAKDRFPDVVWELYADEDGKGKGGEEVWGHKAIVYARAPPSFQARYFSFKPPPVASPTPYSPSPATLAGQSSLSLGLDLTPSRSPSPFRVPSPSPSGTPNTLLRIPTYINPIMFTNELEYLYTGKGLGEAFAFLFDSTDSREDGDSEESRIDKLRKDLVFMWRSRLYSDVRITLEGNFSSTNHESATAIFSSHRFLLVSRSPYFRTRLLTWPGAIVKPITEQQTLNLPSPPFTPASLFFTLGFMYAGTLVFSHRTFDLDTAFHIMRSATYLSLDTLYDEVQARIVQEMMHGLFHAFLEFSEYERATSGKWGIGGCRCRQCARRAPRVLEFASQEDVKNPHLDRGARRALVGLFGEGWAIPEFAKLPQKTRESLLKGLAKRTTPTNIFALLFAAGHGMEKLKTMIDAWADTSRDMILAARRVMDQVLCDQAEECFEQPEWLDLMEADGVRFEDGERVGLVMESVLRGLNEKNAAMVYQTLVSSILLRPHATETDQTMLSSTSHLRVQVEETRLDVLRWLRKKWLGVRQEGGFDNLEGWALKEISGEIEVPTDELMSPGPSSTIRGPTTRTGLRSTLRADVETDTVSMHSMRTSIAARNMAKSPISREPLTSSASSIRSTSRSTMSSTSRVTPNRQLRVRNFVPSGPRPDSKLTPDSSVVADDQSSIAESESTEMTSTVPKPAVSTVAARRSGVSGLTAEDSNRPRSMAASVKTVRSKTSTVRKIPVPSASTLRPPSSLSRPNSTLSTTSDSSTTFKTAPSDLSSRVRRPSAASTVSTTSIRTTPRTAVSHSPKAMQSRQPSVSSTTSAVSTTRKRPSLAPSDSTKAVPTKRAPSMASVRSTASTSMTGRKTPARRVGASTETPDRTSKLSEKPGPPSAASTIKGKNPTRAIHDKTKSIASTSSNTTVQGTLKRKSSSDTIKETAKRGGKENDPALHESQLKIPQLMESLPMSPRGATLDIGIPCIISSKRARFKAFARYIGEVEGESGPWVGVEVPVDDTWPDEKLEGRQWNDGSWGGIRYFQLGTGSEFEYGDGRAVRRRKFDWASQKDRGVKREGDQLSVDRVKRFRSASPTASDVSTSESRGLFVRPRQVLYVVDAVGTDI